MDTINNHKTTTTQCLRSTGSRLRLELPLLGLWHSLFGLMDRVRLGIRVGLVALSSLYLNKRKLLACGVGLVGVYSLFFHQIHLDETIRSDWYFVNNFYFYKSISPWVFLCFASVTWFIATPSKYRFGWIILSIVLSAGIIQILHISLFVDLPNYTNEERNALFNQLPVVYLIPIGLCIAVVFLVSTNELVYFIEHKMKGNHCRLVGIAEMEGVPADVKEQMAKQVAKEYRELKASV